VGRIVAVLVACMAAIAGLAGAHTIEAGAIHGRTAYVLPASLQFALTAVSFGNAQDGWAAAQLNQQGYILHTHDGGRHWALEQSATLPSRHLWSGPSGFLGAPVFVTPQVGYSPVRAGAGPGWNRHHPRWRAALGPAATARPGGRQYGARERTGGVGGGLRPACGQLRRAAALARYGPHLAGGPPGAGNAGGECGAHFR
jgi:hypothetical protein